MATAKEPVPDLAPNPEAEKKPRRIIGPGSERSLGQYFVNEVVVDHADVLLLLCCFISGLLDSVIYDGNVFDPVLFHTKETNALFCQHIAYGTFVSMQTGRVSPLRTCASFYTSKANEQKNPGNTIFVGLGASGPNVNKPFGWAKSLTSIGCFVLGSFFFSRLSALFGPLRRRTLVLSFSIQFIIIFLTAIIIHTRVISAAAVSTTTGTIDWKQEIPIALLSFQAAGQIVGSRALGLSEIPTVVLTSVMCDFASDLKLTAPLTKNVKRNRRFLAFVGILLGAIVGGLMAKATGGMEPVLWFAGGIKFIVVCSWVLWPEKAGSMT